MAIAVETLRLTEAHGAYGIVSTVNKNSSMLVPTGTHSFGIGNRSFTRRSRDVYFVDQLILGKKFYILSNKVVQVAPLPEEIILKVN